MTEVKMHHTLCIYNLLKKNKNHRLLKNFLKRLISALLAFNLLLVIYNIFSCTTNDITNYEDRKLGFTISTGYWDNDSTVTVTISTDRLITPLPRIKVNGNLPDKINNYTDSYGYDFSKMKSDTFFSYKIIYKNDSIQDNIFIPGKIDSLFINDSYIISSYDGDSIVFPKDTDTIHLYWKDRNRSKYYQLDFTSKILDYGSPTFLTEFLSDSSISLHIDWTRKDFNGRASIDIYKMNCLNLYEKPTANSTSETMFVYYFIKGPSYYAFRSIKKQE